jgi:hypothetical protein
MIEFKIYIANEDEYNFGPRYGYSIPSKRTAFVNASLPWSVIQFVMAHEFYHLTDFAQWWVWREVKANFHAALVHPVGAVHCLLLSVFSIKRWQYYIDRIKGRQS